MSIAISPELEAQIEAGVAAGKYKSADAMIREALHLLEERERDDRAAIEEFRRKIQDGLDAIARGETFDGDEVFDELDREDAAHWAPPPDLDFGSRLSPNPICARYRPSSRRTTAKPPAASAKKFGMRFIASPKTPG